MGIQVTEEAAEVLRRSLDLAGIDGSTGGVRLRAAKSLGGGVLVMVEFAEEAAEGEQVEESQGLRLFIEPGLHRLVPNPVVVLEPQHERVVVRAAESP